MARVSGATVHFVTGELDGGPIILQACVPVRADDTVDRLSARILIEEHRIYPEAIETVLGGRWVIDGRQRGTPSSWRFYAVYPPRLSARCVSRIRRFFQ